MSPATALAQNKGPFSLVQLTVIDHNTNCSRPTVLMKDGTPLMKSYQLRHGNEWKARRVREKTDNSWKHAIGKYQKLCITFYTDRIMFDFDGLLDN